MIEIAVLAEVILLAWYSLLYGLSRDDLLPHLLSSWQGKAFILILLLLVLGLFKKSKHDNKYDDDAGDAFFEGSDDD